MRTLINKTQLQAKWKFHLNSIDRISFYRVYQKTVLLSHYKSLKLAALCSTSTKLENHDMGLRQQIWESRCGDLATPSDNLALV